MLYWEERRTFLLSYPWRQNEITAEKPLNETKTAVHKKDSKKQVENQKRDDGEFHVVKLVEHFCDILFLFPKEPTNFLQQKHPYELTRTHQCHQRNQKGQCLNCHPLILINVDQQSYASPSLMLHI